MSQAAQGIYLAAGEEITPEDLTRMGARGWIPLLSNANDTETGIGIPIYGPSRVEFLLALERDGYSADELQTIAEEEEWWIDSLLTVDDLAYIGDDLETVVGYAEEFLQSLDTGQTYDSSGRLVNRSEERVVCEQNLRRFKQFQREGIPEHYRRRIAKCAYRVRALNESIRIWLVETDREKIRAGYSLSVRFDNGLISPIMKAVDSRINWYITIQVAAARSQSDIPTIRVPAFLLHGDKVVSTKTLPPREYDHLWNQYDLDQYLLTWSHIQGEKRCLNCLIKLEDSWSSRRMYCSEKCRNVAKQKRYRERNPEAIMEAQKKYWTTLDD